MSENKRPTKRNKTFRLTWYTFELLARISRITGQSEGQITETAISEYFHNHQEYWPMENMAQAIIRNNEQIDEIRSGWMQEQP